MSKRNIDRKAVSGTQTVLLMNRYLMASWCVQQRYDKLYCSKVLSDAAFAAACHAAVISVLSLRKGFEVLAQRSMAMFFILAVLYIAMSKVSRLS